MEWCMFPPSHSYQCQVFRAKVVLQGCSKDHLLLTPMATNPASLKIQLGSLVWKFSKTHNVPSSPGQEIPESTYGCERQSWKSAFGAKIANHITNSDFYRTARKSIGECLPGALVMICVASIHFWFLITSKIFVILVYCPIHLRWLRSGFQLPKVSLSS